MADKLSSGLAKALRAGEKPNTSVGAAWKTAGNTYFGELALTSDRVLFIQKNWFTFQVQEFPLGRIEAISTSSGVFSADIEVRTDGGHVSRFTRIDKNGARIIAERIRSCVEAARKGGSADLADLLRRLKQLHSDGVLTDEEFNRAKERYIGHAPNEREAMLRTLTSLDDLRKAGVLSQVEFEIKKRDFLATTR